MQAAAPALALRPAKAERLEHDPTGATLQPGDPPSCRRCSTSWELCVGEQRAALCAAAAVKPRNWVSIAWSVPSRSSSIRLSSENAPISRSTVHSSVTYPRRSRMREKQRRKRKHTQKPCASAASAGFTCCSISTADALSALTAPSSSRCPGLQVCGRLPEHREPAHGLRL